MLKLGITLFSGRCHVSRIYPLKKKGLRTETNDIAASIGKRTHKNDLIELLWKMGIYLDDREETLYIGRRMSTGAQQARTWIFVLQPTRWCLGKLI